VRADGVKEMELQSEQAGGIQSRKDDRVEGGHTRNASSFSIAIRGAGKALSARVSRV